MYLWWQHISNTDVLQRSGLPLISDILLNRRQSLFGHIARLDSSVPANAALQLMVNSHEGKKPSTTWTRPSGRPRRTWLNHIQDADARPLSTIWRSEVARGQERNGPSGLCNDDDDDDVPEYWIWANKRNPLSRETFAAASPLPVFHKTCKK